MTDFVRSEAAAVEIGAQEWNQLIKEQLAPEIQDAELVMFAEVCKRTGLEPFASPRQIYPVMRYDGKLRRKKMVIQTGIDGLRAVAERTGNYAGSDDAVFDDQTPEGYPAKATVSVWKMVAGQRVPFTASARWSEFYPGDKQGAMWKKMPHVMLAKCAEAAALRKGFPQQVGALYVDSEMQQADVDLIGDEERELVVHAIMRAGFVEPAARTRASKIRTRDQFDRQMVSVQKLLAEQESASDGDVEDVEPELVDYSNDDLPFGE